MSRDTVHDPIAQTNSLRQLKRLGALIRYESPTTDSLKHKASICVFSDAGRVVDHCQPSFVSGFLIDDLGKDAHFHTLSCMCEKSRRPTKSTGDAEVLAAGEAIDEGKVLRATFELLLDISIGLIVVVDSKDLYTSLSTQRNCVDRSIRADVNCIGLDFETK